MGDAPTEQPVCIWLYICWRGVRFCECLDANDRGIRRCTPDAMAGCPFRKAS